MGSTTVVTSAALVVDADTVILGGWLAFSGDEIVGCGAPGELEGRFQRASRWDFSDLILLPAFVNAHTHLCFSHLRHRVPFRDTFTAWLIEVGATALSDSDDAFAAATREGAAECMRTGTAAVGDATPRWGIWGTLDESGLGGVLFLEVFGFGGAGSENTVGQLERELPELAAKHLGVGVSPHAPYTADAQTYRDCAAFARANDMRLMTHLAETAEEVELLQHGHGPLADFFNLRAAPLGASWQPPGMSPIAYAASLGALGPTTLIAHANYVSSEDIGMMADAGAHVAFCPRSHAFFRHPRHPVEEFLSAGINVALGTDSLASNDSLSMLEEMRDLRQRHPAIQPHVALRMATENGAKALGIESRYGTLAPGKSASFVAIRPAGKAQVTRETAMGAALEGEAEIEASLIAGKRMPADEER